MNTKPPVKGYTTPTKLQLELVNQNKVLEEKLLRRLDALPTTDMNVDRRWLAIARTHFEQGYMALNRAIFRPERIKLENDDAS